MSQPQVQAFAAGESEAALIDQLLLPMPLGPLPERPLVSVLTASYNYARFLGAAIASVQKQTYANWEMIICDDGSSDDSCRVAEDYRRGDSRIRLLRKANGGHASALNAAYFASRGALVCLLDADDFYDPQKLQQVVRTFAGQPSCGFVMHRIVRTDPAGRPQALSPVLLPLPSGWCGPAIVHDQNLFFKAPCSALCLRRETAQRIFPIPVRFRTYADALITSLALLLTRVAGLGAPLAALRVHGGNLTSRAQGSLRVYEEMLANVEELRRREDDFLAALDPRLVRARARHDPTYQVLGLRYILNRLYKAPQAARLLKALLRHPQFQQEPRLRKIFWRSSPFQPDPIFAFAVRSLWGQGVLKRLFSAVMLRRAAAGREAF